MGYKLLVLTLSDSWNSVLCESSMKSILYSELDTLEWKCITTYFSLRKEEESRQVMVYQCCQLCLIDFMKIEKNLRHSMDNLEDCTDLGSLIGNFNCEYQTMWK